MGVGIWPSGRISSSSFDNGYKPDPDPLKYKILDSVQYDKYLIVKIKYPNCINYEGIKILLYEDCTLLDLVQQEVIDPHFSNNKTRKSPIARFVPNDDGMIMAKLLVALLRTSPEEIVWTPDICYICGEEIAPDLTAVYSTGFGLWRHLDCDKVCPE